MVYDRGLMRSILALALALLVLTGAAPGLFTESPVCAAVDGRQARLAAPARTPAKSCCGTPSCAMGAGGECGMSQAHGCAKRDAHHEAQTRAHHSPAADPATTTGALLCASSCGAGGFSVAPATPDPGTFETSRTPEARLAAVRTAPPTDAELPTRNPVPDDPPPRV